jgi:hypothetical protein
VALLLDVPCADEGHEKDNVEITNELIDIDLLAIVFIIVGGELDRVKGPERDEVSLDGSVFMLLIEVEFDCL